MLKGYRTLIIQLILTGGMLAGANQLDPELVAQYIDAAILVWGGLNILLRFVTTSPIFKKG